MNTINHLLVSEQQLRSSLGLNIMNVLFGVFSFVFFAIELITIITWTLDHKLRRSHSPSDDSSITENLNKFEPHDVNNYYINIV